MRRQKLIYNMASSLAVHITEAICGLILPGLILRAYGSEVNGLIHSIAQFLAVISFLDMGIGRVVETSLYEPLSNRNWEKTSQIITSATRFFRRLGIVLGVYVIILCFVYPTFVNHNFDSIYVITLILILSASFFLQYLFIQTDMRLLNADQRMYVLHGVHIATQLINLVVSILLICLGCTIHTLELAAMVLCLWQPVFLRLYVNHHYKLNRKIKYEEEPISNKWYGVAQHIEYIVLSNTDYVVLTLFSTLGNVSVYAIYHMVLAGIGKLVQAAKGSFLALFGELWAKRETEKLEEAFSWFEWIIHTSTILLYGCTVMLIVPFVQVYTKGVYDTEYIQPIFAVIMTVAYTFDCLRTPYNMIILAAGHYKQTQKCYIITAVLNLGISIGMVWHFGLVGVAVGTVISLGYQTIWMAGYSAKYLVNIRKNIKRILVDLIMIALGTGLTIWIHMEEINIRSWIQTAALTGLIWFVVIVVTNMIFYLDMLKKIRAHLAFSKAYK